MIPPTALELAELARVATTYSMDLDRCYVLSQDAINILRRLMFAYEQLKEENKRRTQ